MVRAADGGAVPTQAPASPLAFARSPDFDCCCQVGGTAINQRAD
jgi:hypothetical protein